MLRYLFIDMNSFFASVEQQESPPLRGHPVGVVPLLTQHTCCIAASYEAKAYGVKTGTGVREARQLCPGIRLVVARPKMYVLYHHRIRQAVESCLHVDQVCSIDEMYGRLLGPERQPEAALALARQVKATLRERVGEFVRSSIGLAPNPWLAKVAADLQKPDGLTMILAQQMPEAICCLKLTDLPGIARPMEKRLHAHGVYHVQELCRLTEKELATVWGSKVLGALWWHQLQGNDLPLRPTHRRMVSHSHVLPPAWRRPDTAHAVLVKLIHKAAHRLRRIGYWAQSMTVAMQMMEGLDWARRVPLGPCQDTLTMLQALETAWQQRPPGQPYHVSVVLTELIAPGSATLPLYPDQHKRNALATVMDRLEGKYGKHVL